MSRNRHKTTAKANLLTPALLVLLMALLAPLANAQDGAAGEPVTAGPPAPASVSAAAAAPVLKGEVQHSERLQPVPPGMRSGDTFGADQQQRLQTQPTENQWYRIPDWMAGKWQYEDVHLVYKRDLRTFQEYKNERISKFESTGLWGWQRDRSGHYWQFAGMPNFNKAQSDEADAFYVIRESQPLSQSDRTLRVRMVQTVTVVSRETQRVVSAAQTEGISTYTLLGPAVMKKETSIRTFDQDGLPQFEASNWSFAHRLSDPQPPQKWHGQDLSALFKQYLLSRKLDRLVP